MTLGFDSEVVGLFHAGFMLKLILHPVAEFFFSYHVNRESDKDVYWQGDKNACLPQCELIFPHEIRNDQVDAYILVREVEWVGYFSQKESYWIGDTIQPALSE